jgi:signal transduction histidine kinase
MPISKLLKLTLIDAKTEIIILTSLSALLILVFNLYLEQIVWIYPVILYLTFLLSLLFLKSLNHYRFLLNLETAKEQQLLISGAVGTQKLIFETLNQLHRDNNFLTCDLQQKNQQQNALFSQWIHGLKTSVAVIELASSKSTPDLADIIEENQKLQKILEQALNLLRLNNFVTDYIPEQTQLETLLKQLFNEHKRDFIYNGIFPKLEGNATVYTDPKWCSLLLSQLLSNSIKYSDQGSTIDFFIETNRLVITDYGRGIPEEDQSRIFEMFYTGQNGRHNKEATGIGLFMAHQIAQGLNIHLQLDSIVGHGTKITLNFPSKNNFHL